MTKWKVEYLRTDEMEKKIIELLYLYKDDNVTIENTHYLYKTNTSIYEITIPKDYEIIIFGAIRGCGFLYTKIP